MTRAGIRRRTFLQTGAAGMALAASGGRALGGTGGILMGYWMDRAGAGWPALGGRVPSTRVRTE